MLGFEQQKTHLERMEFSLGKYIGALYTLDQDKAVVSLFLMCVVTVPVIGVTLNSSIIIKLLCTVSF